MHFSEKASESNIFYDCFNCSESETDVYSTSDITEELVSASYTNISYPQIVVTDKVVFELEVEMHFWDSSEVIE